MYDQEVSHAKLDLVYCTFISCSCVFPQKGEQPQLEDNPYIVIYAPDEFHEALSEYENYVEWAKKAMTEEQKEVAERVLQRLHEADAIHVCLDEMDDTTPGQQVKEFTRDDV